MSCFHQPLFKLQMVNKFGMVFYATKVTGTQDKTYLVKRMLLRKNHLSYQFMFLEEDVLGNKDQFDSP